MEDHPSSQEQRRIRSIVAAYGNHKPQIELFHRQLVIALESSRPLASVIHSVRSRVKDADHLADKLARKLKECRDKKISFDITPNNFMVKVNDLVGVRLLHLYTRQITGIDAALRELFKEGKYDLLEGPFARTWDDESRQFFRECKIETQDSPSLYTSVHYVIGSASRTTVTAEIQVRTLMEEVWGEVDHTMNYPNPISSLACREQLKVLARVTSSASRLVDSIFATVEDHNRDKAAKAVKRATRNRQHRA